MCEPGSYLYLRRIIFCQQKERPGFKHAESVEGTLEVALRKQGKEGKIGVLNHTTIEIRKAQNKKNTPASKIFASENLPVIE